MTTLRQVEANRRNAQLSTGPRSDEGKDRSRANALKHGMAGDGVVLPEPLQEQVRRRMDEWQVSLRPSGPFASYLFEQLCVESVRIDVLNSDLDALRRRQAEAEATDGDERRRLEAEETAADLADKPGLVMRRLRRTAAGCDWLIGRWLGLIAILEGGGGWYAHALRLAHDLLGTPEELRSPWHPLGEPGEGRREARLALAREQVEELSRRRSALAEPERVEREAAGRGVGLSETKEQARLRRYLSSNRRRFEWALVQLRRDRGASLPEARPTAATAPVPATPAPPPPLPAVPRPAPSPAKSAFQPVPAVRSRLDDELDILIGRPIATRLAPRRRPTAA